MASNSHSDGLFRIGNIVSCKTCFEERVSGEVMAYDPGSKLLVLKTPSSNSERKTTCDIRVVNLNWANEFRVDATTSEPTPRLPKLNILKLEKRADEATKAKQNTYRLLQEGISPQAQSLFHTISKTLPCKWQGTVILVGEDAKVLPPYQADNCEGKDSAISHIKKIIEKFYKDQPTSST